MTSTMNTIKPEVALKYFLISLALTPSFLNAQPSITQMCEAQARSHYLEEIKRFEIKPEHLSILGAAASLNGQRAQFDIAWRNYGRQAHITECVGKARAAQAAQRNTSQSTQRSNSTIPQRTNSTRNANQDRGTSLVENLNRLTELHESGVLSDEEFNAAKRRLLGL